MTKEQFIAIVADFARTHGVLTTIESTRDGLEVVADPNDVDGLGEAAYDAIIVLDDAIVDLGE